MKKIFFGFFIFFICSDAFCLPLAKPWYQSNLEQFNSGVESAEDGSGQYGYLISTATFGYPSGSVMQNISPREEWLGKRIRLTARLKSKLQAGNANMFMSIISSYEKAYDYMGNREIVGETDWQEYSIVLDVPFEPTADILFGVSLDGRGELFFDDFKFEVVEHDVAVTGIVKEKTKKRGPYNLDFESNKKH